ncbi:filamentous hemagglutinin N-terminal domain-containing protein [Nostoc sp. PA-18-2419]|uniref:two-partner secretion domain-containing protein n=1 Tax=Nostoc sp. PA-18-2419 TaxID=2575443 RepID=UPI00110906B2|nr:filamentous hemagglutinin N-terminal domain-containing protein [Nostoc sp. PA-18-2419]
MQYLKRKLLSHLLLTLEVNLVLVLLSGIVSCSVKAQIIPDGTLGNQNSVVVPDNLNGSPIDRINGGAIQGSNLFHSFQEFNINDGAKAYFTNPGGISNILTRVTGNNASNILGTLGVLGNANLFFINPHGIVFGPNARLDLGGSFVASSADSLVFDNGLKFSATNPQAPPLLTVNIPVALQLRQNPESIVNQSVGLYLLPENTLALVGGNVILDGGNLQVAGGRIELGGLTGAGTVGFNIQESQGIPRVASLSFPNNVERGDVSLSKEAVVNVAAGGGGSIAINSRNVNIEGGGRLLAGIAPGLGSPGTEAGNIEINASDHVVFSGVSVNRSISGAFNQVEAGAQGNSGDINIKANSLEVSDGAQLNASTQGQGNSGTIRAIASDRVVIDGQSVIDPRSSLLSQVRENAQGNSGGIEINAGSVQVTNGGFLDTNTLGRGDSGKIRITAAGQAVFGGESRYNSLSAVQSQVENGAVGKSGGIEINAGSVAITNGAQLGASTSGQGDAGTIAINARDGVVVDGESQKNFLSTVFSQVQQNAVGNSGGIEINAGSVAITNGAQLSASTSGQGDAGTIAINARDGVVVDGESQKNFLSTVFSQVQQNAVGNSGGIEINAGSVAITNGAQLSASTSGQGNAGTIAINARDGVVVSGESQKNFLSTVFSQVQQNAVGNSGGIEINAGSFAITNGAQLSASTSGQGNAGTIDINARDGVVVSGESIYNFRTSILSQVFDGAVGKSGGIAINTPILEVTKGAFLDASTKSSGDAGAIRIAASDRVIFDGESSKGNGSAATSEVTAAAIGNSGGIEISTPILRVTNGAQLNTTTLGKGNSGAIQVTATDNVVVDGTSGDRSLSSSLASEVGIGATGASQGITITTPHLQIGNAGFVSANTNGNGNAGNINVTANNIDLFSGGQIRTNTSGSSKAGDITLNAANSLIMSDLGTAVLAQTENTSTSTGGNIVLASPKNVLIQNGAELSVNSRGSGTGGDIDVQANSLTLDGGTISAETAKQTGGSINLQIADLLQMRRDSKITTNAGTQSQPGATGTGGNIDINTQFIVAFPSQPKGSDITANATYGNGGRVDITATGIFGIEFRDRPRDMLNDITASSEFGGNPGVVNINEPIDPSRNLVELPATVIDPNDQIAQNPCSRGVGSEFTITGRGGLPPSPNEDLSQEATQVGLVEPVTSDRNVKPLQQTSSRHNFKSQISSQIVPAQGWVFNDKGEIVLTAYNPTVIGTHRLAKNLSSCPGR